MKWEYCVVEDVHGEVRFLTAEGCRCVKFRKEEVNSVAQVIARLGEEGWEMVGCGDVSAGLHEIYFKRPSA